MKQLLQDGIISPSSVWRSGTSTLLTIQQRYVIYKIKSSGKTKLLNPHLDLKFIWKKIATMKNMNYEEQFLKSSS